MSNINWYKYTILFFYPTPPKVLRKRRKEEEEKKRNMDVFQKFGYLDGNKITNSIHWYAPKKQNELPNMEDALISNFHTHTNKLHVIQNFWLFYYQFNSNCYRFLLPMLFAKSFTRSYFQNSSTIIKYSLWVTQKFGQYK